MTGSDLLNSNSTAWPLRVRHDNIFVIITMSKHSSNIQDVLSLVAWLHSL